MIYSVRDPVAERSTAPVQGIGRWQADPTPGEIYGSDNLLVTASPMFIGAPLWG